MLTVATDPAPTRPTRELPLIIIGAGPVGVRLVEQLRQREYQRPVWLFGDEPHAPYNRIKLSSLLAGEIPLESIENPPFSPGNLRITQYIGYRITRIWPETRQITDAQQNTYDYHQLVMAVGSRPHIPHIPGVDLSGVFSFRDLKDTQALMARSARSRHCVVAGGGLLGIEAARALQRGHCQVTIIQQAPRIMDRQLDGPAAELLQLQLEAMGILVVVNAGIAEILGDPRVAGVRLRDGRTVQCDTVLLATGIRPNTELARISGIHISRGIQVNDHLETNQPGIFALGECVEHRGQTYGLVAPGHEQAAVLAERLGGGQASYQGSLQHSRLKVLDLPVFSAGEAIDPPPGVRQQTLSFHDQQRGLHRKLVLQQGRLIGALAVGECDETPRWHEALLQRRRISWLSRRRFLRRGQLWNQADNPVAAWPAQTLICQCKTINRGTLSQAMVQGCTSVEQLSAGTGAGSVCGSCRPLLAELVSSRAGQTEARHGARGLFVASLLASLLIALLLTHVASVNYF